MSCGNIKLVGYNNLNNVIIKEHGSNNADYYSCLLYTSPSPRDAHESRMPSSA